MQNEKLADGLYTDLKWYLLPVKYQRNVAHVMNQVQNGAVVTIGPFENLSYDTARIVS